MMFQGFSPLHIIFLVLRLFQVGFAVTIAIIAALSTHPSTSIGLSPSIHFLFFAIATAALCLIPIALHALNKVHFVSDAVIALFWLIVYAIVVHFFNLLSCGSAWNWGTITKGGMCGRWTAVIAVAFLSIVFWAITAGMGFFLGKRASQDAGVEPQWWAPMRFR